MLDTCIYCSSNNIIEIVENFEATVDGKQLIIEGVETIKCADCGERYYTPMASRYIDEKIAEFRKQIIKTNQEE